ncbi:MAG TPA: hypothetical protein VNZ43_14305 [Sphingomonadaceae bacterium]|nr:hypothetical protein [Sphingomonadaceae bacterium]
MRTRITVLVGASLLASCGPKTLTLPKDVVDRAATCGVVEAANARQAINSARGGLPFDEQGRILHYAMLAASQDGSFSQETVAAVVKRMPEMEGDITKGDFTTLVEPCKQAYPATAKAEPDPLPSDPFDNRLGCYELGSFLNRSLQSQSAEYPDRLAEYGSLRRRLDGAVSLAFKRRGATTKEAQDKLRSSALAKMVPLGSPMAVMQECFAKYPDSDAKKA